MCVQALTLYFWSLSQDQFLAQHTNLDLFVAFSVRAFYFPGRSKHRIVDLFTVLPFHLFAVDVMLGPVTHQNLMSAATWKRGVAAVKLCIILEHLYFFRTVLVAKNHIWLDENRGVGSGEARC